MKFEKVIKQYKDINDKDVEETVYFCKECGQGFPKPGQTHFWDVAGTKRCKKRCK